MFSCAGESINIGVVDWENDNAGDNAEVAESLQSSSDSENPTDSISIPSTRRQDRVLDANRLWEWNDSGMYENQYESYFTSSDQDENQPPSGSIPEIALHPTQLGGEEVQPLLPSGNSESPNYPSELPLELPSEQQSQDIRDIFQQPQVKAQKKRQNRKILFIEAKRAKGSISPGNSHHNDAARSSRAKGRNGKMENSLRNKPSGQ